MKKVVSTKKMYLLILLLVACTSVIGSRDVPVTGKIVLPKFAGNIPEGSCLVLYMQKAISCFLCDNPKIGEKIIKNPKLNRNNEISYKIYLPAEAASDLYTASATLNVGWCKSGNEWIRKGDFKQKYSNEFSYLKNIHRNVVGPTIIMKVFGKVHLPKVKFCEFEGKTFNLQEKFVTKDCQEKCECYENGYISCVKFCGDKPINCPTGSREEISINVDAKSKCSCKQRRCEKEQIVSGPTTKTCQIKGETVEIGVEHITSDCSSRCTCYGKNDIRCTELCPPNFVECEPHKERVKIVDTKVPGSKSCFCPIKTCEEDERNPPPTCFYLDKKYHIGKDFINSKCENCTCLHDGNVECSALCNYDDVKCKSDEIYIEYFEEVPGTKCKCRKVECLQQLFVSNECQFEGRIVNDGETFIPDCSRSCKCQGGIVSCTSLCAQENIECPPYEKVEFYNESISANCSCEKKICVPTTNQVRNVLRNNREPNDQEAKLKVTLNKDDLSNKTCQHDGKIYKIGESFIPDNCQGRCKCNADGGIHCVSICPQENIICPDGMVKETYSELVDGKCPCDMTKCKPEKALHPIQENCLYKGKNYRQNEWFVPDDCSGKCMCKNNDQIHCISLCPEDNILCPLRSKYVSYQEKVYGHCFCKKNKCLPAPSNCTHLGKTYSIGERFIANDCSGFCKCSITGGVGCVSLCPPAIVECAPAFIKTPYRNYITEKCYCEREKCEAVPSAKFCFQNGKRYNIGEELIDNNCKAKCFCKEPGILDCEPLCPRKNVECRPGEFYKQVKEKLQETNCTCSKTVCVKAINIPSKCSYKGKSYTFGERFIPDDCSGFCKCNVYGGINCVSLCPPQVVECIPGFVKQSYRHNVSANCFCEREQCRPAALYPRVNFCYDSGNKYAIGENVIDDRCKSKCICRETGILDCSPLCDDKVIECQPDEIYEKFKETVPGTKCQCAKAVCRKVVVVQGDGENINSNTCFRNCARIYAPVCGSNDRTYNNLCLFENAQCADKTLTLKSNEKCEITNEKIKGDIVCPPNQKYHECLFNPCSTATCHGYPQAECKINYCGVTCTAEFFIGSRKVECKKEECPRGIPIVTCRTDPCETASCEAYPNAKCVANFCGGCNTEFYLSSRKIDCSIPKCRREREKLLQTNSGRILLGQYVPQCNALGVYELMQCHERYCWCVNSKTGERLNEKTQNLNAKDCLLLQKTNKEQHKDEKKVEKKSYKIVGYAILKQTLEQVRDNSCLFINVRRNQHAEVIAKRLIVNPRDLKITDNKMRYGIDIKNVLPGEFHISATLNNGWCQESGEKNKPAFKDGDYYTTFAEILSIRSDSKRTVHRKDISLHRINATEVVDKSTLKVSGYIIIDEDSNVKFGENSCVTVKVIDTILCDYVVPCFPKVFGHKRFYEFNVVGNRIPYTIEIDKGEVFRYKISAVINDGWCGDKDKWIRKGDYLSDVAHYFSRNDDDATVFKDIEVRKYGEKPGNLETKQKVVTVSGSVRLPKDVKSPLPKGSCLHLYIQEAIYCLYCENPVLAQKKISNPTLSDHEISYSMELKLPNSKFGRFLIQSTLNIGWCGNENEWIRYNDLHNVFINEFNVDENTNTVNKDLVLERYQSKKPLFTEEADSVSITGDVVLPYGAPINFPKSSCLNMFIQEDIQCDEYCEIPVLARFQLKNPQVLDRRIAFKLTLKNPSSGSYTIHATLNNNWCKTSKEWIRYGDYFNDVSHNFVLTDNQLSHEMDVDVISYERPKQVVKTATSHSPQPRPKLTGHINIKDFDKTLPKNSCLQMFIQENIQCEFCRNPILANITIKNPEVDNGKIKYVFALPKLDEESYSIQAMLRNGYCENVNKPLRQNDLVNIYAYSFDLNQNSNEYKVDIDIRTPPSQTTKPVSKTRFLEGKLQFSKDAEISKGSCLKIQVQRNIQCEFPSCENPFLIKYKTDEIQINNREIPFEVDITDLKEDMYTLQATINQGYCSNFETSIKSGDFFNTDMVSFEVNKADKVTLEDIQMNQYIKKGCTKYGVNYKINDVYYDNCNSCICGKDGMFRCTIMACSTGVCYHEGKEYKNGEKYTTANSECSCTVVSRYNFGKFSCY